MKPRMMYHIMLRSLFQDTAMGTLHDGLSLAVISALLTLLFSIHAPSVLKAHNYYFSSTPPLPVNKIL